MKTINISRKEAIDFINSQPDDRPINFEEAEVQDAEQCGCLLIHLLRWKAPDNKNPISCGFDMATAYTDYKSSIGIKTDFSVNNFLDQPIFNYGDLKRNILLLG